MKNTLSVLIATGALLAGGTAGARDVQVVVTNLTNGTYFTPLLVAAHAPDVHLFEVGQPASANLQAMAEGGDISGLISDVEAADGIYVENPAGGLLAPGDSATAMMEIRGRNPDTTHLSIVGMLLPTNDGFVGLDALEIPIQRGVFNYYLSGYDAGTEANDEIINGGGAPGTPGVPADPGGSGGVGATGAAGVDHNQSVHIHRGVLGDTDPAGGISDLDSRVHHWQNPVARVTIEVVKD